MVLSSTALLLFTIGTLIVVLALLILFHHNLNATKGYKLRSLEFARSQLLINQETVNTDIAKAQALKTFQDDPVITAMQPAVKPTYIKQESSIAQGTAAKETTY